MLTQDFETHEGGDNKLSRDEALQMFIDNGAPNPPRARDKLFLNFDDNQNDKVTEVEYQDFLDYMGDPTNGGMWTLPP
ncbi:MAG: hypothetical protein HN348_35665 [Proteobacteria bacterium]|nr:hypothetical protein [Pseudomonadota bacterium]